MMLCLERYLLHLCLSALRADKLMFVQKYEGHMLPYTYMAQLDMVGVMDLHLASALPATVIIPIVIKISVEAIGFPAGASPLLLGPVIYKISKIIGE